MVPPAGVMKSLIRNADGSWAMSGQDGLSYAFGTDGSLSTIDLDESQPGNAPSFSYGFDPSNAPARLTSVADPMSRKATLSYNGSGRLTSIKTWDGRSTTFGYDPNTARVTSMTDPAGNTTSLAYNDLDGTPTAGLVGGQVQTVTNPRIDQTTFVYGDNVLVAPERVARVIRPGPSAPTTRYVYLTGHTDVALVVSPTRPPARTTGARKWSSTTGIGGCRQRTHSATRPTPPTMPRTTS